MIVQLSMLCALLAQARTSSIGESTSRSPILADWDGSGVIRSEDSEFRLKVGGLVQADGRTFQGDEPDSLLDQFVLRRVRITLEGTLFGIAEVKIMPDFAGGQLVLQDAYLDVTLRPWLRARAGKQKAPFGLERLQHPAHLAFIERAYPTQLAPNRDIGLMIHGELGEKTLQYAIGIFNGVSEGASGDGDISDDKDFVGRVMVQPFSLSDVEWLRNVGLGLAASFGEQEGTPASPGLSSFKSAGQATFFSFASGGSEDAVVASGPRLRWSPQVYYFFGPLGALGELVYVDQEVRRGALATHLSHLAWQAAARGVLTGENASHRGVIPKRPFDISAGGMGAMEFAVRLSSIVLDVDSARLGLAKTKSSYSSVALAVGLNWYLNANLKAAVDFERSSFDGGDRPTEFLIAGRLQLAL